MSDDAVNNTSADTDIDNDVIEIGGNADSSDIGIEAPDVKIDFQELKLQGMEFIQQIVEWSQSPKFYAQIGIIIAAVFLALLASNSFASKKISKLVREKFLLSYLRSRYL